MKHVAVVLGTAREGRESEKVAHAVMEAFRKRGNSELAFVDVRDHVALPRTIRRKDAGADAFKAWQEIAVKADAFVFVIPEYHRGYPGEWKLLVDSLDSEYRGKHAYIVGVSDGIFAGVRMGEHIRTVLVELGFILHRGGFFVGNVDTAFDNAGALIDAASQKRLDAFVEDILAQPAS